MTNTTSETPETRLDRPIANFGNHRILATGSNSRDHPINNVRVEFNRGSHA